MYTLEYRWGLVGIKVDEVNQKQTEELIFEIAGKEGLSVYKLLKANLM